MQEEKIRYSELRKKIESVDEYKSKLQEISNNFKVEKHNLKVNYQRAFDDVLSELAMKLTDVRVGDFIFTADNYQKKVFVYQVYKVQITFAQVGESLDDENLNSFYYKAQRIIADGTLSKRGVDMIFPRNVIAFEKVVNPEFITELMRKEMFLKSKTMKYDF